MTILWIITAIIIFWIIVLIHEWWHFASARFFWVKVEEFWLWIPPRAKKLFTDKKWTLYSLNWLPIWGFVRLAWENPVVFEIYNSEKKLLNNFEIEKNILEKKDIFTKSWEKISEIEKKEILKVLEKNKSPENLSNKKSWQQSIIILAWIFMNFLLAFLIFFFLFLFWVKPIWINDKIKTDLEIKLIPTVEQAMKSGILVKNDGILIAPTKWSLAEKSWLKQNDTILEINNEKISNLNHFQKILENNKNKEIFLKRICLEKCEQNLKIKLWENWKIWAYIWENIKTNPDFIYKFSVFDSAKYAFLETKNQVLMTFKGLGILAKKIFAPETKKERQEAIDSVSWPVWLVNFISNTFSAWIIFLLIIWALISINLWVFNLLPIPALDWWRFIFIVINSFFKKIFWKNFFSQNIENLIHITFFIIFLALSLIIAYNDINKIIW